jgi:hypothetical protein
MITNGYIAKKHIEDKLCGQADRELNRKRRHKASMHNRYMDKKLADEVIYYLTNQVPVKRTEHVLSMANVKLHMQDKRKESKVNTH